MGDMEIVRQFNSELSTIYETKPPISKAKVTSITRLAIKAIKYYKHVVQSIEKFVQKCRQEYKVPALYVMDSLIRGSRHQFGADKDVFGPRFVKNINQTFQLLFKCPSEDQGRVIKVLNLWQKNGIYGPEIIQPLLNMASQNNSQDEGAPEQPMNNKEPLAISEPAVSVMPEAESDYVTMLQQQQQQHLQKIQQLQQQLQEQQKLNQIQSQLPQSSMPLTQLQEQLVPSASTGIQLPQPLKQLIQGHAGQPQQPTQTAPQQPPVAAEAAQQVQAPQLQLQPHIFAQIQALTGMNVRPAQPLPNQNPGQNQAQLPGPFEQGILGTTPEAALLASGQGVENTAQNQPVGPLFPGAAEQGPPNIVSSWTGLSEMPVTQQMDQQNVPQSDDSKKQASLIDDFDYGDEQDDATRLEEQRRHLLEEERRLKQEGNFERNPDLPLNNQQEADTFQSKFRPIGDQNRFEDVYDRSPDKFYGEVEHSRERERSPAHRRRSRSPRNKSPRKRSRSPRQRSRSPVGTERVRDRDRHKDRDKGRKRSERDKKEGRLRRGVPPVVENMLSVCSKTIWAGHVPKMAQRNAVAEIFEEYGSVKSVDMVPPRGCAYVVMEKREDAVRFVEKKLMFRMCGNIIKIAWAPGKGVKGREYKEFFDVNLGVTYIPWDKLVGQHVDLDELGDGGWIDPETLPPGYIAPTEGQKETVENSKDLGNMSQEDLMQLAVAQAPKMTEPPPTTTQPSVSTQIPTSVPPPGHPMYPGPPHQLLAPPVHLMRPPFQGAPHMPPAMIPPTGPPSGAPPLNVQGPPPGHFIPQSGTVDAPHGRGHFLPHQEHQQGMPAGPGRGGHPPFPQPLPFGLRPPADGQGGQFPPRGPRFLPNPPPLNLSGGPPRGPDFRGPPPQGVIPHVIAQSGQSIEHEMQPEQQNGPDQNDLQLSNTAPNIGPDPSASSRKMSTEEPREGLPQERPGNRVGSSQEGVEEDRNDLIEGPHNRLGQEGLPHEGPSFGPPPHGHALGAPQQEGPPLGGPQREGLHHEDPSLDGPGPPPNRWPPHGGPQHEWLQRIAPRDGPPFHGGPRFVRPPPGGPPFGDNLPQRGPPHQGPRGMHGQDGPPHERPMHDGLHHRPHFERPPHGFPNEGPQLRGHLQGPQDGPPHGVPPFERPFFGRPPFGPPQRFRGPSHEPHRGPPPAPGPWGPRGPLHHFRGPRPPHVHMPPPPEWQEGRPQDREEIEKENQNKRPERHPIEEKMIDDQPVQPVQERLSGVLMESQEDHPEQREEGPRMELGGGRWRDREDERQFRDRDREERNSARRRPTRERDSFEGEREKDRDRSSQRDRDRGRDRDRDQDRDRDRYRDRDRDRNRDRDRDRERRRERDRDREQEYDRDRERDFDRNRDRDRDKERDREDRRRRERDDRNDRKRSRDLTEEGRSHSRSESEDGGSQAAGPKLIDTEKPPTQDLPSSSATVPPIAAPASEISVNIVNENLKKNIELAEPEEGEIREDNDCEVVNDTKSGEVLLSATNADKELKSQINDKNTDLQKQNETNEVEAMSS